MIAEKYAQSNQQLLLITNNLYQADKLETITQIIDAEELYKYPVQDIMTEEFSTQSPSTDKVEHINLTALAQGKKGLFIVPLNGLKKWLTPVEMWQNHQMTLRVGKDIDVDQFLNKLVNMGYKRESVVSHIGEFSLRGGIIDIFPLIGEPIRIELFDTEIDSIRDFDVETQRSKDNVEEVDITTASDYIITEEVMSHLKEELKTAYENTEPKIDKSVRNDLKETYENFEILRKYIFDHQILRRLVAFMYETPSTIEYLQKMQSLQLMNLIVLKKLKKALGRV